jgi:hypothetical protein
VCPEDRSTQDVHGESTETVSGMFQCYVITAARLWQRDETDQRRLVDYWCIVVENFSSRDAVRSLALYNGNKSISVRVKCIWSIPVAVHVVPLPFGN